MYPVQCPAGVEPVPRRDAARQLRGAPVRRVHRHLHEDAWPATPTRWSAPSPSSSARRGSASSSRGSTPPRTPASISISTCTSPSTPTPGPSAPPSRRTAPGRTASSITIETGLPPMPIWFPATNVAAHAGATGISDSMTLENNTCYNDPRGVGAQWAALRHGLPQSPASTSTTSPATSPSPTPTTPTSARPENINVDYPPDKQWFRVGVHYYCNHGETYAVHPEVKIFCNGALSADLGPQRLLHAHRRPSRSRRRTAPASGDGQPLLARRRRGLHHRQLRQRRPAWCSPSTPTPTSMTPLLTLDTAVERHLRAGLAAAPHERDTRRNREPRALPARPARRPLRELLPARQPPEPPARLLDPLHRSSPAAAARRTASGELWAVVLRRRDRRPRRRQARGAPRPRPLRPRRRSPSASTTPASTPPGSPARPRRAATASPGICVITATSRRSSSSPLPSTRRGSPAPRASSACPWPSTRARSTSTGAPSTWAAGSAARTTTGGRSTPTTTPGDRSPASTTHPGTFLELATARLKLGPAWTPFMTPVVLRHEGREHAANTPRRARCGRAPRSTTSPGASASRRTRSAPPATSPPIARTSSGSPT